MIVCSGTKNKTLTVRTHVAVATSHLCVPCGPPVAMKDSCPVRSDLINRIWEQIFRVTRPRRMRKFAEWAAVGPETTVLDVGGTDSIWQLLPIKPDLTLLNLQARETWATQVVGDGTKLPFPDQSFDVVFSNSVIEHVPDHDAFAKEVQRVGRRYFIQTPNKAFPFEPHVLTPGVNYLPKRWQKRVFRSFTVWGWIARPTQAYVDQLVDETNLLSRHEVKKLFPAGETVGIRSLIARGGPSASTGP